MKIRETFFSKEFAVKVKNSYEAATTIFEGMDKIGSVVEKENIYQTDGPVNKVTISFDVVEIIDDFSRLIISIDMEGNDTRVKGKNENSRLNIKMTYTFESSVKSYGYFSEQFGQFYLGKFFNRAKKQAEEKSNSLLKEIESKIADTVIQNKA